MKKVIAIALAYGVLFAQVSYAAPICTSYQNLSSEDRQNIADTRFDLESIEQSISDIEYGASFNQIINKHAEDFNKVVLHNYLQGLIAEALFRRYVYQSIGLDNMAYRRFQIFADLILYHKAMDHKGFVKPELFAKAKTNLEAEINNYYRQKQGAFIAQIHTVKNSSADSSALEQIDATISKAKALEFLELENKRMQMLGSIEIMWSELLDRNQFNQTEVLADLAIADISINAATAIIGFSALVGYGPAFLQTARATWALPLSIAVGCGFGASNRYFSEGMTASYLEMSRALYQSVQNHTSFACELGQKINSDGTKNIVQIPDAVPAANSTDYLIACAAVGTSMVFPKIAGFTFGGVLLGSLAVSSHHLLMESLIVLEEIPRLYQLKEQLKDLQSPEEIALLEKQINDSRAKITLYLLAFGNSSIEAFRLGIFLYGGRSQVQDTVNKAKVFLAGRQLNDRADLQLMNLILGGMTPHLHH